MFVSLFKMAKSFENNDNLNLILQKQKILFLFKRNVPCN